RSACKRALRAQLIRLGQNVQAERAERAGSLVDKYASGPAHEGIALVPAQLEGQAGGQFYHVKGTVGMGMDYECRSGYNFGRSRSFKDKVYQF
ncbi:hypothetical protein PtrSN001C_011865, partial [Pyrenophora tritici-repentis]